MHSRKQFISFEEGIKEIRQLVPQLKKYLGEEENISLENHKELIKHLFEFISKDENFPMMNDIDYPKVYAISAKANEFGFKTKCNIAFGWHINVNNGGVCIYTFRISINGYSVPLKVIEKALADNGWAQSQIMSRRRYPNGYTRRFVNSNKEYPNISEYTTSAGV